jgi:fimbrial chaperone protein
MAVPLGIAMVLGAAVQVRAAEFAISPISLELTPGVRSSSVGIRNADQRPLRFQLSLVEWTQDAQGNDVYTPSDDLVYFPRQLSVRPGDRVIARVGPKQDPTGAEKTYRLRIEELPDTASDVPLATNSAALKMMISFAVPVFQGTPDAIPMAVIAPTQMKNGQLNITVQNAGRSHFRIDKLEITGANGYSQGLAGWYLLAGVSRQHSLSIAPEVCRAQQHLNLTIKVGNRAYTSDMAVDPSMCGT